MSAERPPHPPYPHLQPVERQEWVGPEGDQENVARVTDRDLILRCVHELMCMRQDFGKMLAEVGRWGQRVRTLEDWRNGSDDEITAVRDMRDIVRRSKRTVLGVAVGAAAIVIAAYVCMKLGIKIP